MLELSVSCACQKSCIYLQGKLHSSWHSYILQLEHASEGELMREIQSLKALPERLISLQWLHVICLSLLNDRSTHKGSFKSAALIDRD